MVLLTKNSFKMNIKNKKRSKGVLKFLLPAFFIFGIASVSHITNYSLKVSNNMDIALSQVHSIKNYDDFKYKMDHTPYSDEDFKKDIDLFKLIYDRPQEIKFNRSFYTFYDMKILFNGNKQKIDQFFEYNPLYKDTELEQKQSELKKSFFNDKYLYYDKLISKLRLTNRNILPGYVYDNTEKYLKENNITDSLFFRTQKQDDDLRIGDRKELNKKMDRYYTENVNQINDILNKIKEGKSDEVRNIFRIANAYQQQLSTKNIIRSTTNMNGKDIDNDKILNFSYTLDEYLNKTVQKIKDRGNEDTNDRAFLYW